MEISISKVEFCKRMQNFYNKVKSVVFDTLLMEKQMIKKLLLALLLVPALAWCWEPPRQVTATVGYTPGSGNELSFRGIAAIVEKNNPGTSFIVNNMPGAGEVVGLNWFTKLPTTGANIFIASQQGVYTATEIWYPELAKFRPMDLEIVTTIAKSPLAVVASINSPTNTPKELVERLKNTKQPITFGLGATAHKIVFEYLMEKGGGNADQVKTVMYKGPGMVMQDIGGNHIEFGILPTAVAYPLVQAGKAKYIALAGEQKLAQIPNVPLWKDSIPGLNVYAAWMITMPPGTPRAQVDYYNKLFVPAIRSREAKEFFDANLMFTVPEEQTPEGAKAYITGLRQQWMPYIRKILLE
jgi:tripartite-type tricarboxylate transporter receptor subunit TctC